MFFPIPLRTRMLTKVFIILQICYIFTKATILPEDAKLNFTGLAVKYGHQPIEYKVITEDGYILTVYRLPGQSFYPVLLMHGIYDSSDTFLIRGNESLGITLANDGYDVCFGNARGNRYSRKHVLLDPDKDPSFWKFSFHEIGYYDLAAIIDGILNKTNSQKLTAIGHSQGNTAFLVLGATRSEYNAKINIMMALAPICYIHHTPAPISNLIKFSPFLENTVAELQLYEFLGDNSAVREALKLICITPIVGYEVCAVGIVFSLSGYDSIELEPSFYPITATHIPAGGSSMTVLHFLQIGRRKIFARYDYGNEQNQVIYNSSSPPVYDLESVTMPVALFTGRNDRLSTLTDVAILKQQLPNVVYDLVNPRLLMNHVDYVMGRTMKEYLFPIIYDLLEQYNGLGTDSRSGF